VLYSPCDLRLNPEVGLDKEQAHLLRDRMDVMAKMEHYAEVEGKFLGLEQRLHSMGLENNELMHTLKKTEQQLHAEKVGRDRVAELETRSLALNSEISRLSEAVTSKGERLDSANRQVNSLCI
jgi:chromosome segregation ATPase